MKLIRGMSWEADYNLVAPQNGEKLDVIGLVTIDNHSGKSFDNARVKLMAGDVSKIQRVLQQVQVTAQRGVDPLVTERSFGESHLYTLQRPLTLRDRETKQVEFVRASGVSFKRLYVYNGAESNPKVRVMWEFKNSKENGLGIPLPKGRLRFYQRDEDGQLEFVGENNIDHTPKDETVSVYVGNAFDIVGERTQTKVDNSDNWADESFDIILRNRKKEAVEVRVVEHLESWPDDNREMRERFNWEIREHSDAFSKLDAQKVEFRVKLEPDEEKELTYSVRYSLVV